MDCNFAVNVHLHQAAAAAAITKLNDKKYEVFGNSDKPAMRQIFSSHVARTVTARNWAPTKSPAFTNLVSKIIRSCQTRDGV